MCRANVLKFLMPMPLMLPAAPWSISFFDLYTMLPKTCADFLCTCDLTGTKLAWNKFSTSVHEVKTKSGDNLYWPFFHSWWVQVIYISMFSFIIAMAICGNFTVIWIVLTHNRMRTVTNYFLLNLAIADASITIFNTSVTFTYNLYYHWIFGVELCAASNVMGVAPTYASVFTLMSMSLDRYMAIVHPLRTRLSRKKTMGAIVVIWLVAFLCASPNVLSYTITYYFYSTDSNKITKSTMCHPEISKNDDLFDWYNHFMFGTSYFLPLVVLTVTYTRVAIDLWGSQSIGEHRNEESIRTKKKVIKMMIAIVGLFLVCWLPYHVYFSFLRKGILVLSDLETLHVYLNMYWLAMSSTIVNPIIYCWMNNRFRTGFRYAFRWLPCIHITREEYLGSELVRDERRMSMAVRAQRMSSYTSRNRASEMVQLKKAQRRRTDSYNGLSLQAEAMIDREEISVAPQTVS